MSARGAGWSGCLAAVARAMRGRLRRDGRRAALALVMAAGVGVWVGAVAGARAFASGEAGGSPAGAQSPSTGTSSCPSPNPPNQLTLVAGTPQTTTLDTAFGSGLQVALSNSDGCAVTGAAGVAVTFRAPAAGASGRFSASNSNTVTVGADASGNVTAPMFANGSAGSYTVTASSQYGSVSFSLTNTAAGIPARIVAIPLKSRSARVNARFPEPLQAKVLDAGGNPVAGATVTFTLASASASASASACSASAAASSAGFLTGGTQASATTGASGLATSPALTANAAAGSFAATAAVSSAGGAEGAGKAGSPSVTPVSFSLVNLAGKPAKVAPGVGATQSAPAGATFPIRLAVTVTDADKNPVPGALVTFSAPVAGAGGRFSLHTHDSHSHRAHVSYGHAVAVKTGACGIAVAPPFIASRQPGGYIVKASVKPAKPAAFALVNEAP
jgi:protocatechuate 3,4-dioxygenase beta subunit